MISRVRPSAIHQESENYLASFNTGDEERFSLKDFDDRCASFPKVIAVSVSDGVDVEGLKPGDTILTINGTNVFNATPKRFLELIDLSDNKLDCEVLSESKAIESRRMDKRKSKSTGFGFLIRFPLIEAPIYFKLNYFEGQLYASFQHKVKLIDGCGSELTELKLDDGSKEVNYITSGIIGAKVISEEKIYSHQDY